MSRELKLRNKFYSWNNHICIEYHNDTNYQLFETEEGSFIFNKEVDLVYKVKTEAFSKLLINIASVELHFHETKSNKSLL